MSNISQMLDRLQTLATESASQTFTGNRQTLDTEYQGLLTEINRQADNIGLGDDNAVNATNLGVYIGGGQSSFANSAVNVPRGPPRLREGLSHGWSGAGGYPTRRTASRASFQCIVASSFYNSRSPSYCLS